MRRLEDTFRKCTKHYLDYKQKYALSEFIFGGFIIHRGPNADALNLAETSEKISF